MNRLQLVSKIAEKNEISKVKAAAVLKTVLEEITASVKNGESVQLIGFGTFKVQERKARTGRNPATGASIKIPAARLPKFVPGAQFKTAVNVKKRATRTRRAAAKKTAAAKK